MLTRLTEDGRRFRQLSRLLVWTLLLLCLGQGRAQVVGTVRGSVVDTDGDFVSGAIVTLIDAATNEQKTRTDEEGRFQFTSVYPGTFQVAIQAEGMAAGSAVGTLQTEELIMPQIELRVAPAIEGVDVILTRKEEAQIEVTAEEHQRLAGFLPNFYVSYTWNAAPLTKGQKFDLAWRTTLDPATILVNGGIAGVEQATNSLPGYGQGAAGYGKRFGAATADTAIGNMLGGWVLPVLLKQDPRYFYKGTGTIVSRTLYALASAVICKGDNGRWQPNYSSILGDLGAGAASNLYYPAGDRNGATLTIENGLLSTVSDAVGNLVQEFIFKKITPHAGRP